MYEGGCGEKKYWLRQEKRCRPPQYRVHQTLFIFDALMELGDIYEAANGVSDLYLVIELAGHLLPSTDLNRLAPNDECFLVDAF